ncbi:MAG: HD domain-containing protein [Treponema sp.]|nr:HD domain-containing protein [Treponema sp.]
MPKDSRSVFIQKLSSVNSAEAIRITRALELIKNTPQNVCEDAASILLDLGMDTDTVIAALIYPLPAAAFEEFGAAAAALALGVKRTANLRNNSKTNREAQNIVDMIFALTSDIREIFIIITVKLAMLRILDTSSVPEASVPEASVEPTLSEQEPADGVPAPDIKKTAARECLDIYAPLADRLGIAWIKNEMEDLCLKFLNRETYRQIKNLVAQKKGERARFLEQVQQTLKAEASASGIDTEIDSRAKHFYSIYMKMRKRGVSAEKIYDLSGIRIICSSVENCYLLLGIVHRLWKPQSGCFKDYIANPKPNGYRSLHTTVMVTPDKPDGDKPDADIPDADKPETSGAGKLLEVQIRTREMHQVAEHGAASHWLYKKGAFRRNGQTDLVYTDRDAADFSPLWLENIKDGIFNDAVYVFTPQEKVIRLPVGSTAIDFAYYIHTSVGDHCIGAKANGSIISLGSPLRNTQSIEILTSQSAHPHFNWLELAKSAKARGKIRSWLEKNDASYKPEKPEEVKTAAAAEPPVDMPAAGINTQVQKIIAPLNSVLQVSVEKEKNMMIRFARCCNPLPGDAIAGYVSRGRGVIIHRKDCSRLAGNIESEKRRINVEWENSGEVIVKRFRIEAKYSANLFSAIESAVRKRQGHLIEGRLEEASGSELTGVFAMQLVRAGDLRPVMRNIRIIPGILKIEAID